MSITVQPQIEILQRKRNYISLVDPTPQFLQSNSDYRAQDIQITVTDIKYAIQRVPHGGRGNETQRNQDTSSVFKSFRNDSTNGATLPAHPRQVIVDGLEPGTTYWIKLRARYSTGEIVESGEIEFETLPLTGINCLFYHCMW